MPVGFYFVPMDLELFAILMCKLVRGEVPGALNNVFEHIRILEFHPALLRETYIENMEDRCIYFFSRRLFAAKARNKRQPMRVANGGTWKASGGSKTVRSKKVGGIDVGQKLTMVFYERRFEGDQNPVKTNWAMHEYTKIIPSSKNQLEDLAVYRLYKIRRKEDTEPVNAAAAASSTDKPSTPEALPPPTPPPRPLLNMAGSSSATSLLPPQLPGLAGSSSTMPLALPLQLPGLPGAAIPPEPMAPPKNSPAVLPPADAGGNYDHPELADYGGGVQAQHEHHQPQELTDGADGDAQLELGAAEFDSERVAEMISQIMDGEFVFKFEDDTIVSFNEVAAAPMLIDGGGDGDGDGADGGVGDDPFDN
ncbi:hypothetical protein OsJ_31449 [Oryza sativa Japonica Group]|uniref:NAC domain-containing protein n=1 Tax=Oryza sativa subsp. japonica TaxID=39947 RepID=B9G5M4_ORYSJ|nr:hypothetical protein OsJ_31449 [Oryza sativa Japonica Group]